MYHLIITYRLPCAGLGLTNSEKDAMQSAVSLPISDTAMFADSADDLEEIGEKIVEYMCGGTGSKVLTLLIEKKAIIYFNNIDTSLLQRRRLRFYTCCYSRHMGKLDNY